MYACQWRHERSFGHPTTGSDEFVLSDYHSSLIGTVALWIALYDSEQKVPGRSKEKNLIIVEIREDAVHSAGRPSLVPDSGSQ